MSAEDFEMLQSQDANDPNLEEKNIVNENDENGDQISTDLIASDVQFTNSQSVSQHSQIADDNDDNNNDIQQAIQSPLIPSITSSELHSKSPSKSELLSNHEQIRMPPNNMNHENENSEQDDSDMNMEETPPLNQNNNNNINNNYIFSEKHDQKEQEQDDEEQEGSIPPEGNVANIDINNDNIPIVSSINNMTPNHDRNKKIYDNPYLNGSKSTPGGDEQDGEDSDNIDIDDNDSDHDEDDDDDIMKQPNFTLNDESDEEKDEMEHKNDNKKQQRQINDNYIIQAPPIKHKSYLSTIMMVISIIMGIIAYYYGNHRTSTPLPASQKPDPPKFHCPASVIYVPMDGKSFYINASHPDHPVTTTYEWDINNMNDYDDLFVDGEDSSNLLLMTSSESKIWIDLYISSTIDNIYVFNKQCSINVIFHESPYFGIDLGTTYSCIGYQERGGKSGNIRNTKIIVVDKHRGEYCIPTAIYFPPTNNQSREVIIGEDALKKLAIDPENVIYDIKRIIGRNCNDPEIKSFKNKHSFNITCDDNDNDNNASDYPKLFIPNLGNGNGEYIVPEQALSVILAHLVSIASKEFGVPYIRDVVVSIPALFHNGQRKAIRSSCNLVGLNVKQLVVEPTAAALAYSYYSSTPSDNFKLFLTFDIGGGTIDCSVLRCTGVDCQVLGVKGNSSLGGIDFDYIIKDIMIQKYKKIHKWNNINTSNKLKAKFLKVAERVKKSLSVSTQHQVTMTNDELLKDDFSTYYTEKKQIMITRKEFEEHPRTKELIDSAIETAKRAINTERIKASNIRMILMVGGTTKIPIIQQRLKEEFGIGSDGNGKNERELKLVFPADDPQLMVVKGSAIIGASLAFNEMDGDAALKQIVLEDVIPLSLGFSICLTNLEDNISTRCGIMDVIVEKNSHYPTRSEVTYCQKDPKSNVAKLDLYEGDDEYVKNNYLLSHLSISGIPERDPSVCDSIIVEFIIDKNGIATIEAIINDKNKSDVERERFSNSLDVVSNDGSLSSDDIEMLKSRMIAWFKGHESIQSALLEK